MKNFLVLLSTILFSVVLYGQDNYHLELISSFQEDNNLEVPSFIFENSEVGNIGAMYTYGSASSTISDVEGFDFSKQLSYSVPSVGANQWDAGTGIKNKKSIDKDDVIVFTFWAKRNGAISEVQFFVEDGTNFEKEFYQSIAFTPDWNQYFIAVQAGKNYGIDKMAVGFHLAAMVQDFELAGLTGFNFGPIEIEDVPSTFGVGAYEGSEADAPWRAAAAARIEEIRKADLTIKVVDMSGNPISGADIQVEMQEHEFKFGSAFVTCRFQGNNCFNQTYVNKIFDLDGKGHGFNAGVTENAMKWDGWEEGWIGTPSETANAVKYLSDQGVQMRGHTLIWPGYSNMPDDIVQNKDDLSYLRGRLSERINEMINHPILSDVVREWDVLNEITQNRDLESAFMADPNFTTGREIYQEIMAEVRAQDPDVKLYINDYIVLSGGGSSTSVVIRYKEYLDEIHNSDQPFDGIGFQAHIGGNPTSIVKAESVFDDFYERYGKRMSVTEYDISDLVDPEVQRDYMADFLTLTFSHPSMDAFLMWGFWDGNHWKQNAPMFDMDWNIKPGGQAFIDKVFGEWWTDEMTSSDEEGKAVVRAFKGKHKITVSMGGDKEEMVVDLTEDADVTLQLAGSSSVHDLLQDDLLVFPSVISEGSFQVQSAGLVEHVNIDLYNTSGILMKSVRNVNMGEEVMVDELPGGMYIVKLGTKEGSSTKKIQVVK